MIPEPLSNPTCCPEVQGHIAWLQPSKWEPGVEEPGWCMGQEVAVPIKYCMFCGKKLECDVKPQ